MKRTKIVYRDIWTVLSVLLLMFMTIGCDEDPISVGEGILPDEDIIKIDTLIINDIIRSYSFDFPVQTGGSANLFAGETEDIRVQSVFRFDSLLIYRNITPEMIRNDDAFEAKLILNPIAYQGASDQILPLDLYEVRSIWLPTGFNREVFDVLDRSRSPVASGSYIPDDTLDVEFDLPKELLIKWAEQGKQFTMPGGLILSSPVGSSGIVAFRGDAGTNAPRLRIIIGTSESRDTLVFSQNTRAFAADMRREFDGENNIILQAGTSIRSILKFDLSVLPERTLIHNARLELTQDPDLSTVSEFSTESIVVNPLADPFKRIFSTVYQSEFTTVKDSVSGFTVYSAHVTPIVQEWVVRGSSHGFYLRDLNETLGFHRTSFYTEAISDATLRPRLVIIYSRF